MANVRGIVIAKIFKEVDGEWEYFGQYITFTHRDEWFEDDEDFWITAANKAWGDDWEGFEVMGQINHTYVKSV